MSSDPYDLIAAGLCYCCTGSGALVDVFGIPYECRACNGSGHTSASWREWMRRALAEAS